MTTSIRCTSVGKSTPAKSSLTMSSALFDAAPAAYDTRKALKGTVVRGIEGGVAGNRLIRQGTRVWGSSRIL